MPTVAYLGPEKTNTHLAALKRFGQKAKYLHAPMVEDVFQMVEQEKADFGVVPIENSLEGAVTHTLDRFIGAQDSPVRICGEIELPIQHYLITVPGVPLREIQSVFSHPQALAQCRFWLRRKLQRVRLVETSSTSDAVSLLRHGVFGLGEDYHSRAAIGRIELARQRRLKATRIPQERENKTRFLVIGLKKPKLGRRNKTSVVFALKDKPGALHDALMPFKRNRINMTKIESRPSKQKAWEYLFFVDLAGAESDPSVRKALGALQRSTSGMRVLGSYPVGSRS